MKNTAGTAAKANRSAVSRNGGASPTPNFIATKVRPQTVAVSSALRVSRGLMTPSEPKFSGGLAPRRRSCGRRSAAFLHHFHGYDRALVERLHRQSQRSHADQVGRRQNRGDADDRDDRVATHLGEVLGIDDADVGQQRQDYR